MTFLNLINSPYRSRENGFCNTSARVANPAPTWNVGAIFTKPPSAAEPAKQAS
jgi:hypothetical protein